MTLGLLYAAPAAGAFLATLLSGRAKHVRRQGRAILFAIAVWGAAIIVFGLSDALWLSLAMLAVAGAGDMVSGIYRSTILQAAVEDRLRGRLDGIGMAVWATGPSVGNVESGAVATLTTVPISIVSGRPAHDRGDRRAAVVRAGLLALRRPEPDALTSGVVPRGSARVSSASPSHPSRPQNREAHRGAARVQHVLYKAIVFIHVFAAIVWVGGAFFFQVKIAQLQRADDTQGFLQLGRDAEHFGQRLFMPASVVVLLAGIALVWYGPYAFELWIGLSLAGIVATALTGSLFLGPQGGEVAALAQEKGVDDPAVAAARIV